MKRSLLAALILTCSLYTLGQQVTNNTFGKGISIVAADSSFSMKFSTRIQSLFIAEMPADNNGMEDVSTNWMIRRSRLKFDGFAFDPKFQYKIELGLSNRDHGGESPETNNTSNLILDAFVRYNVFGNVEIWAGQTKLPGNRERVISSQKLQFVDRSLVNSRFNLDRDMGVQIRNKSKLGKMIIKQAVAVSQGEGRNRTVGNQGGLEYTGRLEFLPLGKFTGKGDYFGSDLKREQKPKIAFGVTYDYNDRAPRERGNLGSYVPDTAYNSLATVMADVMFKYKGFSLMAEYADKQAEGTRFVDTTGAFVTNYFTGSGISVQGGYLLKNNLEISGRVTSITPEKASGRDIQDMYTFGLSRYIVGHSLKVQTDFSLIRDTDQFTSDVTDEYLWRFQIEMAF
jgi:phosphate-selective porin OprO/OprP